VKFVISSTITSSSLQQEFRSRKALTQFPSKPLAEARVAGEDESAGEIGQVLGRGHHYLICKLRDAGELCLVCRALERLVSLNQAVFSETEQDEEYVYTKVQQRPH
jgi:hypothetical protein